MNKETKQILINQVTILRLLAEGKEFKEGEIYSVSKRLKETEELLNPKQSPSLPSKTKNALRGK